MPQSQRFSRFRLAHILTLLLIVVVTATSYAHQRKSQKHVYSVPTVQGWAYFEDESFDIRFQYPIDWTVSKESNPCISLSEGRALNLAGEDNALICDAKSEEDAFIRIIPPNAEYLDVPRGGVGIVPTSIVILRPGTIYTNNHLRSSVTRSQSREYESVLDPYGNDFRFEYVTHLTAVDRFASTSLSIGHSPDNTIKGATAVKTFANDLSIQAYVIVNNNTPSNDLEIAYFTAMLNTLTPLGH